MNSPANEQNVMGAAAALVMLAARRDPVAWEALVMLHGAEIFRAARRITGDAQMAEDACQETLLYLRDQAAQFKPAASEPDRAARAWILKIAARTALTMLRGKRRMMKRERLHSETVRKIEMPQNKLEEAVRQEVIALPDELRLPVTLRFYGDLDYPEMAAELGLSEEAARKRVSRGLEKLRERLALAGLVLALGQISAALTGGEAQAAEVTGTVSAEQVAHWRALINSKARAGSTGAIKGEGHSLMAKISIGVGVGLCAVAIFSLATNGSGGEAGTDKKEAKPVPTKKDPNVPPASTSTVNKKTDKLDKAEKADRTDKADKPSNAGAAKTVKTDVEIRAALSAAKLSFKWNDTPLSDVAAQLSQKLGVPVVLGDKVDGTRPLSFVVTGMEGKAVLEWIEKLSETHAVIKDGKISFNQP